MPIRGRALPEEDYYEDYVQIENGVGMLRSLITEFEAAVTGTPSACSTSDTWRSSKKTSGRESFARGAVGALCG